MAAKADGTAAAVAPEYDDSIYIPMHEKNKGKGKGKGGSGSGGSAVAPGESGADAPAEAAGAAPQPSRQRIDVYEFVRHGNLIVGIHKIVVRCQERLEGNCLCTMQVARTHGMAICPATCRFTLQTAGKATLRENLYRLAARSPSILEVGFNAGCVDMRMLHGHGHSPHRPWPAACCAREPTAVMAPPGTRTAGSISS